MKRQILLLLVLCVSVAALAQKVYRVSSPDGQVKLAVQVGDEISFDLSCGDVPLLQQCRLAMDMNGKQPGVNPKVSRVRTREVHETKHPVVPMKFSTVTNHYNLLTLTCKGGYDVEFRAYDQGVAYRFVTRQKGEVEVLHETMEIGFAGNCPLHLQQPGGFKTSYEEMYSHLDSRDWKPTDKMSELPVLVEAQKGYKVLVCESALTDYPAMFLKGNGQNGATSTFPKVPLTFGDDGDRSVKILSEAPYIAKTTGNRAFPWRYFVVSRTDGDLLENTMSCCLAEDNVLTDTSWIKPGMVSWEWWNGAAPYGPDVNFKTGCNLETYKYFIDFASKYNIPYIIMDEGWAKSTRDPFTPNPDVDLHELIRYGKEKNVGIVLWLTWLTVENHMNLFETFEKWGVKGVKIDFMDRSDQWMVNFYERVARKAAEHKLFVDFHGSFKPAGLEHKYPNVLSYEGVRGMEQMGGCRPENSVYLPFMRNAVGAMDYTPGAMLSMQPEIYYSNRPNSASIGTRAYQMALFVVFESGLQMMADSPTNYYRNDDCTRFMTSVPVVWDETVALHAEAGEYAVVAKRNGEQWYVGGMTNNTPRRLQLDTDFLEAGKTYKMVSFVDGTNAGTQAMDYRRCERMVKRGDKIEVDMARNGGFAAQFIAQSFK